MQQSHFWRHWPQHDNDGGCNNCVSSAEQLWAWWYSKTIDRGNHKYPIYSKRLEIPHHLALWLSSAEAGQKPSHISLHLWKGRIFIQLSSGVDIIYGRLPYSRVNMSFGMECETILSCRISRIPVKIKVKSEWAMRARNVSSILNALNDDFEMKHRHSFHKNSNKITTFSL